MSTTTPKLIACELCQVEVEDCVHLRMERRTPPPSDPPCRCQRCRRFVMLWPNITPHKSNLIEAQYRHFIMSRY